MAAIKDEIYKYFADMVFNKTGIFYPEKDYYRLDSRIQSLMTKYECESVEDLYKMFQTKMNKEMETTLIDICTNNETYFFRDEKPFQALKEFIYPELKKEDVHNINIWSAACSSGQEALSILMSLDQAGAPLSNISIDATDISQQILDKAKSGVYTGLEVQRGLPITNLMKYFEQLEGNSWKAKSVIHSRIKYAHFNLFSDFYQKNKYHVIFCRNVLIYQNAQNKESILNKMYEALAPGGYLILGAGESLIGTKTQFEHSNIGQIMCFRKNK